MMPVVVALILVVGLFCLLLLLAYAACRFAQDVVEITDAHRAKAARYRDSRDQR